MKQVRVKITLDLEADVDDKGRIDQDALREQVNQQLGELIEDDSLEFDVETDEDEDEDY